MTTSELQPLTHVERPDDPAYLALSRAEAEFWSARQTGLLESVELAGGNSPIERYTNRRFTGDEGRQWFMTIASRGHYTRGLVLGTSAMGQDAYVLEANPYLSLTICDIAAGSLERWQSKLGARFPGRVETMTADFNFLELPKNTYDLILSSSTLHHVINLEQVAAQINSALTPEGRFFLQDYVGETLFRFDERKKRVFELLYNRDIARQRGRKPGLTWLNEDRDRFSPFCGIRSGETLRIMAETLDQKELRTAGTIGGLMLYVAPADQARVGRVARLRQRAVNRLRRIVPLLEKWPQPSLLSREYLHELLTVDEVLSDANAFVPYNAFAVYGKR